MWVLGVEPLSSGREISALSHFSSLPMNLFSQEISSSHQKHVLLLSNDIDGGSEIHGLHLVPEAQCTALDQVLNTTADHSHSSQLLFVSSPFVKQQLLFSFQGHSDLQGYD